MRLTALIASLLLVASISSPAAGQRRMPGGAMRGGPEVGDALPDAVLFTADGEPFEFSRVRENHAVIVFGCLT